MLMLVKSFAEEFKANLEASKVFLVQTTPNISEGLSFGCFSYLAKTCYLRFLWESCPRSGAQGYLDLAAGTRIFCPHCSVYGPYEKEYASSFTVPYQYGVFFVKDKDGREHQEQRKIYNARAQELLAATLQTR